MTRTDLHALLGQRWALPVLTALVASPLRFNELKRACHGVTPRMLAKTLRALSEAGLVAAIDSRQYLATPLGCQAQAWSNLLPVSE